MQRNGKIHVLQVTQCLDLGGLEMLMIELCRRLDRKKYRVSVLCFDGYDERYKELLGQYNIPVYLIKKRNRYDLSFFINVAAFMRIIRTDIIHTHGGCFFYSSIVGKLAGIKNMVYTVHGMPVNSGWRARFEDYIAGACTDRIVAVSDEVALYLKENVGIRANKMETIINGIDTDRFRPSKDAEEIREKRSLFGLPHHRKIIGSVGRLEHVKNYPMLLKAFAESVHSFRNDSHLVFVGDGREATNLERLAGQLRVQDRVSFLGMQYDMPSIYPLFDLFALSSFTEGTSLSLLEAQSCGVPAVVTDVGGNSNIIKDGVNGFLCGSSDHSAMAVRFDRLINNDMERTRMGSLSRELMVRNFGISSMLEKYDRLYRNCLGN